MGLKEEEIKERAELFKNLKVITTKEVDENAYIFVSYKSDDYKAVYKVVKQLQDNFGVNVYCDADFENHSSSWVENMDYFLKYSSAVLAFISPAYLLSYATLFECKTAIMNNVEIVPYYLEEKAFEKLKPSEGLTPVIITNKDEKDYLKKLKLDKKINKASDVHERFIEIRDKNFHQIKYTSTAIDSLLASLREAAQKTFDINRQERLRKDICVHTNYAQNISDEGAIRSTTEQEKRNEEISSGQVYLEAVKQMVEKHPVLIDNWKSGQIYRAPKENAKQQKECFLSDGTRYFVNLNITIDVMKKNYSDMISFVGIGSEEAVLGGANKGIEGAVLSEKENSDLTTNNEDLNDIEIVSGQTYLEAVTRLVERHHELIDGWKIGQIYSERKENAKQQKECSLSDGTQYYVNLNIVIDVMKKNYSDMLKFVESSNTLQH